jgi:hypothetical protein
LLAALIALGLMPGVAQAQTPTRCLPLGGLLVGQVIRQNNEVTELLGHGAYRVTRCNDAGFLQISMTVAPVKLDGKTTLAPEAIVKNGRMRVIDRGDPRDPRWAKVWRRVRARVRDTVLPKTPGQPQPEAKTAAKGECEDGKYIKTGSFWFDTGYAWQWHKKSFGGNTDTLESLKKGHTAWDNSKTNCSLGDLTPFKSVYDGKTSKHVGFDGVNVVDKGSLKEVGCQGALACTQVFYGFAGVATEVDVRFGDQWKWSNSGAAGKYDYRSIATHEFGHALGLSDLYDNPKLTMSYSVTTGDTAFRTLGKGDIFGLRALYEAP